MKQSVQDDLQISQFIKDPASLKLLILAGTKIKPTQIATVNKCTSLIKLDLSSNQLLQLPLKFTNFLHMRILYLHDNQLTECQVARTNLEYISLFDNHMSGYRADLISNNHKLVAIDCNVITPAQKVTLCAPRPHSELKWPIVQISQQLQHEEDYLNLLKAELFVINQVYKKASFIDKVNNYFKTIKQMRAFRQLRSSYTNQTFFKVQSARKAATQWICFTQQRKKLKRILAGSAVEVFTLNKIERIKACRSKGVGEVVTRFMQSIRIKMRARKILQKVIRQYRARIPVLHSLENEFANEGTTLYFKNSQFEHLDKIMRYARKLFFNKKQYDLCDNFDRLVVRGKHSYYIYRARDQAGDSMLHSMIKMSMGLILGQKDVDRRAVLYNKRGHKDIQIKRVRRKTIKFDEDKMKLAQVRIDRLYERYDTLISLEFKNMKIYSTILALLRYFNSGNAERIEQNRAAYFQTEVVFDQPKEQKQQTRISYCSYGLMRRAIAANIIQKAWRRHKALKELDQNITREVKVERAKQLINRWARDLKFRHRMQLSKTHSFLKSVTKENELYLQMDIYMNLPRPTNILDYKLEQLGIKDNEDLYHLIHTKTETEIVEIVGRSWLKIKFMSCSEAVSVRKKLSILSYKYYFNGFYLNLFALSDVQRSRDFNEYERKAKIMFGITFNNIQQTSNEKIKKIEIDNSNPIFIWPYVEEGFASMFKPEQIQCLPISVFIYNKNRRPLKVNCDLLLANTPSIYYYRKKLKAQIRVKTPKKELEQTVDLYMMPHMRHKLHRQRQYSMKQHKSLLQANRQRGHSQMVQLSLLSETLNIKRQ